MKDKEFLQQLFLSKTELLSSVLTYKVSQRTIELLWETVLCKA